MPYPRLGFANLLYLWLAAATHHDAGEDWVVLHSPAMDPWLPGLPRLAELTIDRAEMRLLDWREVYPYYQEFGRDFTREQLEAFVRERLLDAPLLQGLDEITPSMDTIALNIRRGDYYSDVRFRGMYSFDIAEYVRLALAGTLAQDGPASHLRVVSDDPDWCRLKLGFLADQHSVTYVEPGRPLEHFWELCGARRLILTNSTFSYWGAYVSNVVHGDNHQQVWAPWFHRRDIHDGRAWQLDPRWSVVRDLPGGWDS
jgi:hypothetical protein